MSAVFPDIILLAGGMGTRLQSVVRDVPKPMAPVAGKPFLEWLLLHLQPYRPGQFILSTGYKHEVVEACFGNNFNGIPIRYAIENEPLGTGGAIQFAMEYAQSDHCLVINGDTWFDINHQALFDFHMNNKALFTMALKPITNPYRYGTVEMEGARITRFLEKDPSIPMGLINTGVYCISKEILPYFPALRSFSLEKDFMEPKTAEIPMYGFVSDGYFIDIGIPEDYQMANEAFLKRNP